MLLLLLLLLLLLWDRNFFKYAHVRQLVGRGAHLSARVKTGLVFVPTERLPDGSYLAKAYRNAADRKADRGGIPVPVVEHTLDDPARVGHRQGHRLVTTRLDPALYPALERVELYHVRREQELAIDEPKTHEPAAGAGGRGRAAEPDAGRRVPGGARPDAGPLRCWPTQARGQPLGGPPPLVELPDRQQAGVGRDLPGVPLDDHGRLREKVEHDLVNALRRHAVLFCLV